MGEKNSEIKYKVYDITVDKEKSKYSVKRKPIMIYKVYLPTKVLKRLLERVNPNLMEFVLSETQKYNINEEKR